MSEANAVTLVTGASRGLGRGIALHLAGHGYSVVINYASNAQAAEETLKSCKAAQVDDGQQFITIKADISNREERVNLVESTLKQLGRIDVLINNAGIAPRVRADITEATEESFEELIRTNLQGPYFLTQSVANYWLNTAVKPVLQNGFKIIFVTSVSANTASINRGDYCISKAGLSMASQLWSVRLAESGIQVFEFRPGIMKTDMTHSVRDKYEKFISEGLIPEKRWGTPDDVGRAVTAAVRGDLPFATGSIIHIDGGLNLRRL